MKTEQEQIKEMTSIIVETLQDKRVENGTTFVTYLPSLFGNNPDKEKEVAETLIENGYGDVSEYKAEIERLKEETSNIRKETAKEILGILYDMSIDKEILECCRIFDVNGVSLAKQICEKYGVEIEK